MIYNYLKAEYIEKLEAEYIEKLERNLRKVERLISAIITLSKKKN